MELLIRKRKVTVKHSITTRKYAVVYSWLCTFPANNTTFKYIKNTYGPVIKQFVTQPSKKNLYCESKFLSTGVVNIYSNKAM